ncbi:MAG TPA: hypothetical protein VKX41_15195 [Alloacidobacterium sp.]|nr:hypothetical protein [Alloacidobacterium sp.]
MAKFRKRETNQEFLVFSDNTSLGWRIIRRTSFSAGESRVEKGIWRRVYDDMSNHIGYQPFGAGPTDKEIPSRSSNPSISLREMEAFAGTAFARGKSRTAHLSESRRMERIARKFAPEDFIERTAEKVRLWKRLAPRREDPLCVKVSPCQS